MSYLAEVLSSAEKMELEQINTKCPELAAAVDVCKSNVLTYLENVYVRFRERPKQNKILANKLSQLQEETTSLINTVEEVTKKDLHKAETEMKSHLDSLERINITLTVVGSLSRIHEALIEIRELQDSHLYLQCMQKMKETNNVINSVPADERLPVLDQLSLAINTEKSSLLNKLSNMFKDNVILKPMENKSVIKIKNENDAMKQALSALYAYKTSVAPLDNVTRFLWNYVFVPVVDCTTEIKTNVENNFATMEIITVDPNKKSSYAEVFANIKTVLSFLLDNFNISLAEDLSTLTYIGRDIRDNLSELLIKHCLQDTIPSTAEGLQKYKVVIDATEDLEKALVASKIFAEDTTSILEYANNIDILFINKKCKDYLILAQNLMKKDLHDLVEVGVDETNSLEIATGFPRCSVSRNVVELLNLLEKILSEAVSSSEVCAGRLFCTVKNICQIYGKFVPEHHKKLLQTIPQQIAVFYNNCMYISRKLSDWNDSHLRKLPSLLNIGPRSFNDEGRQLREMASEMFADYVDGQIKQIEEIMRDANLQRQTLEQLDGSTEKCLRQCLRQQELLKTVWQRVLPYSMYNKTVGVILNSLCNHAVDAIVKCDDISSEAAEHLVELFKMVQTRGPKLFTDPKEVSLFVGSWYRLSELVFVLSTSLVDINDRWADGKGPLALQFKPEELKQLVRALFQNTERRAALLAKIHD
ncbi:Zw10 domain containing protein [Asbolus verrucosus]|uniref:Zw10 domain containing protein n=1 Tax=Asbolus verrucosus TaxID=1661398 RepID=A0A482WCK4_ASBVE|nr:Zw10 domain containing protein [Asbolus verrucosus]